MKRKLAAPEGSVWGRLTVVRAATREEALAANPKTDAPNSSGLFRCACGVEIVRGWSKVMCGNTRSCGCYGRMRRAEANAAATVVVDGVATSKHPLIRTWSSMWQRCTNPKRDGWLNYGGRGISVCDRWHSFPAFVQDITEALGPRPKGMTLDRWPNPDGDYEPGNVRWATKLEQAHNQRRVLANSLLFEGEVLARPEVARRLGISHSCLRVRMRTWPQELWFEPAGFAYIPRSERAAKCSNTAIAKAAREGRVCVSDLANRAGIPAYVVYNRKKLGWPSELWAAPEGYKLTTPRYLFGGAVLTCAEIAAHCGKSADTVSRWARLGRLERVVDTALLASALFDERPGPEALS